jgi:two-component system response regulator MprA
VLYNVAEVEPFVLALTDHARLAVVVEISPQHPMSAWSPAFEHFWGIERPTGPTADDLIGVITELGSEPEHAISARGPLSAFASDPANLMPTARRPLARSRLTSVHTQRSPWSDVLGHVDVLLAEDDRAVRESLVRALGLEGYQVRAVSNGALALDALRQQPADLLLLDVSMPVLDGLTVCRVLRGEKNRIPILMLTARTETSDRVAGLDAGADDYLPKPFDLAELYARMRALLRRAQPDETPEAAETLTLADLRIDTAGRRVTRGGVEIELSKTEYELLELLVRNTGVVLEHSTIYDRIWNYDFGPDSKNLAVYIGYLRRKTEEAGGARLIHTVRGVGYVAREEP